MAILKTYNGKDSKSYLTEERANTAIEKAQTKVGDKCTYMVAHCHISERFVPIVLNSENPVAYARLGFKTFG